ncbi:FAD-dependent monooxygenase [Paenibacillus sambharensis]|uniref:FAD-dependent monooxygenase n=1 Tax=Paenibacillus sambharensis TaxID=1803190 RepID=A0A2W1L8C6_9BACL|nr:NAD(P)/FAD-dependent oxidoreductase [Paenibacillus sambharensis]PZD96418.1 FAD-dependent monooxygenase [Paenibacillus sambharensis]
MRCQVFISGGGIAGLTLGLLLSRHGINVIVAEKKRGEGLMYKGELLQPKSLQILDQLDTLRPLEQTSFKVRTMRLKELTDLHSLSGAGSRDAVMDYGVLEPPYDFALMHPHEKLKGLLMEEALQCPCFTMLQPGHVTGLEHDDSGRAEAAIVKTPDEELRIEADFFVGAEGRISPVRETMNVSMNRTEYNHHFLTVSFRKPAELTEATILSHDSRFLGLFPLPDNRVRTVYLIRPEEYKPMRSGGLDSFYQAYRELYPPMEGCVEEIESWKEIQLMIPFRHQASQFVQHNIAIIGDAAHNVHPMAGEGMNMAIQDADILGQLLVYLYKERLPLDNALYAYDSVRRPRAEFIANLSHLSALAYSYTFPGMSSIRPRILQSIAKSPYLHYKYMLNISGLGMWPDTLADRFTQLGIWPKRRTLSSQEKLRHRFSSEEDYPWLTGYKPLAE